MEIVMFFMGSIVFMEFKKIIFICVIYCFSLCCCWLIIIFLVWFGLFLFILWVFVVGIEIGVRLVFCRRVLRILIVFLWVKSWVERRWVRWLRVRSGWW